MAVGLVIWRFDGRPPCPPDDPCLDDSPMFAGLVPPNPAIPFGPHQELRAVFDRHLPRIYWNAEGSSGFYRRGHFQFSVILPSQDLPMISLAIDELYETERVLRAIEAERPDWYTAWEANRWLRDVPPSQGL